MVRREVAVEGGGEGACLDGADAEDADAVGAGGANDVAGAGRVIEAAHAAGGVEEVRDDLGDGGRGRGSEGFDNGGGDADTGDAPGADAAFVDQALERGDHGAGERGRGDARGDADLGGGVDRAVEDEDVDAVRRMRWRLASRLAEMRS